MLLLTEVVEGGTYKSISTHGFKTSIHEMNLINLKIL